MRCKICGRILKDLESIDRGYGPICDRKRRLGQWQLELNFAPKLRREMTEKEKYEIVKKLLESSV